MFQSEQPYTSGVLPVFAFRAAVPVWMDSKAATSDPALTAFHVELPRQAGQAAELRVAAHDFYRAWIDGEVVAQGPARAAPGHARVDRIPLPPTKTDTIARLVVEVSHDAFPRYDRAHGPGFLAAEVLEKGEVRVATGAVGDWRWANCGWRRRPMEKFSMQRGRIEAWRFPDPAHPGNWGSSLEAAPGGSPLALPDGKRPVFLERRSALPKRDQQEARAAATGRFRVSDQALRAVDLWWTTPEMKDCLMRSERSEHALDVPDLLSRIEYSDAADDAESDHPAKGKHLAAGEWLRLGFGGDQTGFPELRVVCEAPVRLLVTFDELLTAGEVDPLRNKGYAAFHWELGPGRYRLRPFDPYCLQWLQLHVLAGSLRLEFATFERFEHPLPEPPAAGEGPLGPVLQAARATFRQNALDIFMDCPGRERAGWLCDSFFTARAEWFFTGGNPVEDDFLENFLPVDRYEGVPEGLLPMCWPADNPMGQYIPQWALWFVLEIADRAQRGGDPDIARAAEAKVRGVLDWFARHRDESGFAVDLPGWNFVEWSKSNELTEGLNYPTQFLLAAALAAAGERYGEPAWIEDADRLRTAAAAASFDGSWFRDQALRENGSWHPLRETTETCQYYAFFFGAATPESHPETWRALVKDCGPGRDVANVFPQLHPSNAFIGNLLRFHCLARHGENERLRAEVLDYYAPMAAQTGTLWEHSGPEASCNHGFAAAIAPLLADAALPIPGVSAS